MYTINKKNNIRFVLAYSIVALLLLSSFWLIQKIDSINMMNNGYISNEAIVFIMKEQELNLENVKGDYLLFHFNKAKGENIKQIRIKGEIQLPSIKYISSENEALTNNTTIIGKRVPAKKIPEKYHIIGNFDVENKYKLFNEVWIVTNHDKYFADFGQHFIFQSPNKRTRDEFKLFLETQSVKVITPDVVGTYASKGNQILIILLKLMSIFLVIVLIVLITIRLYKEKDQLHILYLYGISFKRLLYKIFLLPFVLQLVSLLIITIGFFYFSNEYANFWSNEWKQKVLLSSGVLTVYMMFLSLLFLYRFTVKRGGRKI